MEKRRIIPKKLPFGATYSPRPKIPRQRDLFSKAFRSWIRRECVKYDLSEEGYSPCHPDYRMILVPERFHQEFFPSWIEIRHGKGHVIPDGIWLDTENGKVYGFVTKN